MADLTAEIRRKYKELIYNEFPRFEEELATLKGEKYVSAYLAACRFVLPTISAISLDEGGKVSSVRDLLRDIANYRREEKQ